MRIHPISLALRYLKGQRTIRGRPRFAGEAEAVSALRRLTGQDFGNDPTRWGRWLRRNRWVYYARSDDPRIKGAVGPNR